VVITDAGLIVSNQSSKQASTGKIEIP